MKCARLIDLYRRGIVIQPRIDRLRNACPVQHQTQTKKTRQKMTTTDSAFHIFVNGTDYGVHPGETYAEALCAMIRDAGYTASVVDGIVVGDFHVPSPESWPGDPSNAIYEFKSMNNRDLFQ
jgi:hypothetical protein